MIRDRYKRTILCVSVPYIFELYTYYYNISTYLAMGLIAAVRQYSTQNLFYFLLIKLLYIV